MAAILGVLVFASVALGTLSPRAGGAHGGATASASAASSPAPSSSAPVDVAAYLYPVPRPAPAIDLTDTTDRPFSLSSLRGAPAFVFFGYTHCPDVCPATIGTVGLTLEASGPGPRAVFVSVDPERDTTTWLREFARFLPTGFVALTGTSGDIRATADAWDVRYARVETGVADAYSMAHTADVYLVDAAGMMRARFPFGTSSEAMSAVLQTVQATPVTTPTATPVPAATPAATPGASPAPTAAARRRGHLVLGLVRERWSGDPGLVRERCPTR